MCYSTAPGQFGNKRLHHMWTRSVLLPETKAHKVLKARPLALWQLCLMTHRQQRTLDKVKKQCLMKLTGSS